MKKVQRREISWQFHQRELSNPRSYRVTWESREKSAWNWAQVSSGMVWKVLLCKEFDFTCRQWPSLKDFRQRGKRARLVSIIELIWANVQRGDDGLTVHVCLFQLAPRYTWSSSENYWASKGSDILITIFLPVICLHVFGKFEQFDKLHKCLLYMLIGLESLSWRFTYFSHTNQLYLI